MSLPSGMQITNSFEHYLHSRSLEPVPDGSECEGCGRNDLRCWSEPTIVKDKPMLTCEACLRYAHGCDQEEEIMVRALLGAVVRAALEQGASRELVRNAVAQALDADIAREALEEGRWAGRMEEPAR